jgi:DNA-binding NarL/FixJ family response regulator
MTELPEVPGRLSQTDVEILRLLAQGHSLSVISETVYLSRGVLSRRVQMLMTRLGARDRAELATRAEEMGLG